MLALVLALGGDPELPTFFSDHMVLQRETRAPLWGTAPAGERLELRASWAPESVVAVTADSAGRWRGELVTPAAGGPHEITIAGSSGARVLRDVLVGEVWLASGQSNMEWTLGPRMGDGVEGWEEAARAAGDPMLRFFEVKNALATAPRADVRASGWVVSDPESAAAFSATAYFFARRLRAELGVPVGVISADWGGTPAEAWMRAEALRTFPEFAADLARQALHERDPGQAEERWRVESERYWQRAYELDAARGLAAAPLESADDAAWPAVDLPATWEQHGLADFDGLAWYRRTLELPAAWAGQALVLELGAIDDRDTAFWNGERVGGHEGDGEWQTPRRYTVPAALVRGGANVLAVRVLDTGGLGGFASGAKALRLYPERDPAGALALAGSWRWHAGTPLAELGWPPTREAFGPGSPSVLWNKMIAPLVPCALRGVLWYQGEANRERAEQYRALFPALITDWRAAFGRGDFPFYFVQIAPFAYAGDTGQAARLREAQRAALALPNTGMAVTMDIGDPADIHPRKKREVGERLALWALARTYGRELECSGPLYRAMTVAGGTVRVELEHARGLTSRGEPVRHVTIAGTERVFHPAVARIEGETLLVHCPDVPAPVAVRFGWGAADETNLWNAAGLPASSFRSDDWP